MLEPDIGPKLLPQYRPTIGEQDSAHINDMLNDGSFFASCVCMDEIDYQWGSVRLIQHESTDKHIALLICNEVHKMLEGQILNEANKAIKLFRSHVSNISVIGQGEADEIAHSVAKKQNLQCYTFNTTSPVSRHKNHYPFCVGPDVPEDETPHIHLSKPLLELFKQFDPGEYEEGDYIQEIQKRVAEGIGSVDDKGCDFSLDEYSYII